MIIISPTNNATPKVTVKVTIRIINSLSVRISQLYLRVNQLKSQSLELAPKIVNTKKLIPPKLESIAPYTRVLLVVRLKSLFYSVFLIKILFALIVFKSFFYTQVILKYVLVGIKLESINASISHSIIR